MNGRDIDNNVIRDNSPYDNHMQDWTGFPETGRESPVGDAVYYNDNYGDDDDGDGTQTESVGGLYHLTPMMVTFFGRGGDGDDKAMKVGGQYSGSNYRGWHVRFRNDRVRLGIYPNEEDSHWFTVYGDFELWHHFALAFDKEQIWMYVDGIQEKNENHAIAEDDFPIDYMSDRFQIGRGGWNNNGTFGGELSEIRYYNRVLADKEIKTLHSMRNQQVMRV